MPKTLLHRIRNDSIREFREAAFERFDDGLACASAGRRTSAIYLWGYSVEMILKASYFALIGKGDKDLIYIRRDLRQAIQDGLQMKISWPAQGQGHNIQAWAELLVSTRALSQATSYDIPFGIEVQNRGQRVYSLWRETLRYRKNRAYPHEMIQVRESAEWFLTQSNQL